MDHYLRGPALQPQEDIPSFDDRRFFAGWSPSATYLKNLFLQEFYCEEYFGFNGGLKKYCELALQQFTDGAWMKHDASHKVPADIFIDGKRVFDTLITFTNEYNQVNR